MFCYSSPLGVFIFYMRWLDRLNEFLQYRLLILVSMTQNLRNVYTVLWAEEKSRGKNSIVCCFSSSDQSVWIWFVVATRGQNEKAIRLLCCKEKKVKRCFETFSTILSP